MLADLIDKGGNRYSVFPRHKIPEEWHYRKSSHVMSMVAVAYEGNLFSHNIKQPMYDTFGWNGYRPENIDMLTPLLASGPEFKAKPQLHKNLVAVDLFPLLCTVLDIPFPEGKNGSVETVRALLTSGGSVVEKTKKQMEDAYNYVVHRPMAGASDAIAIRSRP